MICEFNYVTSCNDQALRPMHSRISAMNIFFFAALLCFATRVGFSLLLLLLLLLCIVANDERASSTNSTMLNKRAIMRVQSRAVLRMYRNGTWGIITFHCAHVR